MPRIIPRNIAKLDSIPDVNAGSPSDNDALTWDNATGKWIPEAVAAGGQILYDAVVAPSGGDYTSVVTACATEASGATIFIRAGTYVETADVVLKNKQRLIGERREETIIDFDNQAYQVYGLNFVNGVTLENLTIKNSADTDGNVYLSGCKYSLIRNCRITAGTTQTHGIYFIGNNSIISNCIIENFSGSSKYGIGYTGDECRIYGNYIDNCRRAIRAGFRNVITNNYINATDSIYGMMLNSDCVCVGNLIKNGGFYINGGTTVVVGNRFAGSDYVRTNAYDNNVFVGNYFKNSRILNASGGDYNTFVGNTFNASSNNDFFGESNTISNNTFSGSSYVRIYGKYNTVIGNNFEGSSAANKLIDSGIANNIKNNTGVNSLLEKDFHKVKNTSGGALVAGDIVVLKAVAAGDEVTTTTAQGDDKVFGMLEENIADAAYGYVQTLGKTVRFKVDGTTDIAIGDFIGTFTSAGIGMKAAAGDMAIAIALEAYATDDSAGVIDALLITPRKI